MMTIPEAISDLLFVRETVVVSGLGAFVKKPVSAQVDLETCRFTPPSSRVEFDAALREENDLVVKYLSENNKVSETEAKKALAEFVAECFNVLKSNKPFVLDGLGSLIYDAKGEIAFTQDGSANFNSEAFGLTEFTVSPVERPKTIDKEPITVNQETEPENQETEPDDKHGKKKLPWYWAIVAACVLIGGFFGWRQWINPPQKPSQPAVVTNSTTEPQAIPPTTVKHDTLAVAPLVTDSADVSTITPVLYRVVPSTEFRVIAGCYDREENALWFANVLYGVGFKEAFYEPHGERWFVSFAHYATYEEALEALMEIRNNTNYQAWIQVPQELKKNNYVKEE